MPRRRRRLRRSGEVWSAHPRGDVAVNDVLGPSDTPCHRIDTDRCAELYPSTVATTPSELHTHQDVSASCALCTQPVDDAPPRHMTAAEFREHGRAVVDWVADYWERVESLPVLSTVPPGAVRAQLPSSPPESGEPFADLLDDMDRIIVPGLTHWQHRLHTTMRQRRATLAIPLSAVGPVLHLKWAPSPGRRVRQDAISPLCLDCSIRRAPVSAAAPRTCSSCSQRVTRSASIIIMTSGKA